MVNEVVPDDELEAAVAALARRLAGGPPRAFAATKRLLNARYYGSFGAQLEDEAVLQQEMVASDDHQEGVAAFLEKRAPVFRGS